MGKWHSLTSVSDDYGVGVGNSLFFSVSFPTLNHTVAFFICAATPISKIKRTTALPPSPGPSRFMMAGLLSSDYMPETGCLLTLHRGKVGVTKWKLEFQCWTKSCW